MSVLAVKTMRERCSRPGKLAAAMVHVPDLPGLIAVCGGAAGLLGAVLGLIPRAEGLREVFGNMVLGFGVGTIAGTGIAFAIWVPLRIAA
jgi:hypothetical protein